MSFPVGARVEADKNGRGVVAFVGTTEFSEGEWIGVILDEPRGKNNGSVKGKEYFKCEPNHGLFIRASQLKPEAAGVKTRSMAAGLKAPTSGLKKDSPGRSPITSPKMSPAASRENISNKSTTPRKPSSSKLSEMDKTKPSPPKSALAKEPPAPLAPQKSPISRENSNLSSPQPEKQQPVVDLVKKVEEKQASMPSTPIQPAAAMTFEDTTSVERMKVEIKDLNEKLETLRIKRREDQGKIKALEIEAQKTSTLMQVRTKLVDENKELMRNLEEAKRELVELREYRSHQQEHSSSSGEELEMALIEKEIAEEKVDMVNQENEHLKEQIEELKTNLEILRREMADAGSGGSGPIGNSVQMKQMEAQNDKLKQAVIKLRDLYEKSNSTKLEFEKQITKMDAEIVDLLEAGELYKKQAEEAEKRISEYQEQADAALGAEEMVTVLTSKNMEMEDKIAQLEADKDELEALHDMDDQLAEAQKEVEKDLRLDIEALNSKIRDLYQTLLVEEKRNDDLLKTIMKFREKTAALNEQIQDRDDQILRFQEALTGQLSEEKSAASLALQQQVNSSKIFLETVERHLNSIELDYSRKHNSYLKAFLPDNFTKPGGDSDCVLLNIIFPRIVAKSTVFPKLLAEKFPSVPGGCRREHITKSHKAEQWAQVAKVNYLCSSLATVCSQFESALQKMSVESLARISQIQPDICAHERSLDSYIELLKQGRFDENTSMESLKKGINYFISSLSVNVGYEGYSCHNYFELLAKQMATAMGWSKLSAQRTTFVLDSNGGSSEVGAFLDKLTVEIGQAEQLISRIGKTIPEAEFNINQQILEEAQATVMMLERLNDLLHEVANNSGQQVSMNSEIDGLDAQLMKEIIHTAVEKSFGVTAQDKAFEPIEKHLFGIKSSLSDLLSAFEKGNFVQIQENKQVFPPVLERAHLRKQAAAEAEGLRWQLEKKDLEIQELRKGVKSKMDEIGNYRLRLEMATARENSSGQQVTARTKALEDARDQLQLDMSKQKLDFEQQQELLLAEVRELQREKEELIKTKSTMSKMALFQSMQSQAVPSTGSLTKATTPSTPEAAATRAELNLLELSLEESQKSLRTANLEIVKLRSQLGGKGLYVELPDLVCGPETLRMAKSDPILDDLEKEAEHLKREGLKYGVFIPDYSKPPQKWEEERKKFYEGKQRLQDRIATIRARLHRHWLNSNPGAPFPTKQKAEEKKPISQVKFNSDEFNKILSKWGTATRA